jgi:hypothetical protein
MQLSKPGLLNKKSAQIIKYRCSVKTTFLPSSTADQPPISQECANRPWQAFQRDFKAPAVTFPSALSFLGQHSNPKSGSRSLTLPPHRQVARNGQERRVRGEEERLDT